MDPFARFLLKLCKNLAYNERWNLNLLSMSNLKFWRRQWQPTPVLLPGNSHRRRSLVRLQIWSLGFPWCLSNLQCRRCRFNPWVGKIPWRRKCNPLLYSHLGNPTDSGAWQSTVHGVTVGHNIALNNTKQFDAYDICWVNSKMTSFWKRFIWLIFQIHFYFIDFPVLSLCCFLHSGQRQLYEKRVYIKEKKVVLEDW